MKALTVGQQVKIDVTGFAGCHVETHTVEQVASDGTAYYRPYTWAELTPVPGTGALAVPLTPVSPAPARSARDAYYDARFEYYRTMGEDYTDSAEWAAADRDARFTRWEPTEALTGFGSWQES